MAFFIFVLLRVLQYLVFEMISRELLIDKFVLYFFVSFVCSYSLQSKVKVIWKRVIVVMYNDNLSSRYFNNNYNWKSMYRNFIPDSVIVLYSRKIVL